MPGRALLLRLAARGLGAVDGARRRRGRAHRVLGASGGDQARELAAALLRLAGEEVAHQLGGARAHAAFAAGQHRRRRQEAGQVVGCGAAGQVAGVALEGSQLGDDAVEVRRRPHGLRDGRRVLLILGHLGHVVLRFALEEAAPGAQLPEHHAEGVDIDARVTGVAVRHLGRDVARLGEDHARDRVAAAVLSAGRAEVDDLDVAAEAEHHVLRRQVAVHDGQRAPGGVLAMLQVSERLGDHRRHRHRVGPGHALADGQGARAHVTEAATLDVLDDGVRLAGGVLDGRVQHLGHAVVGELRLDARLVEEAGDEARVGGVLAPDDLHHHRALCALEAGGRRQEDLAHATAGDATEQDVAPEGAREVGRRRARPRRGRGVGGRLRFGRRSRHAGDLRGGGGFGPSSGPAASRRGLTARRGTAPGDRRMSPSRRRPEGTIADPRRRSWDTSTSSPAAARRRVARQPRCMKEG
ncbi:MAG: hypothetical protein WKG00_31185 [Polyangiaceae bacterium]